MMTFAVLLFLYSFLRTVFFVVVFYYLFRFLIRVFAPFFGYQQVNRSASNKQQRQAREEGEVRVENPRDNQSKYRRDEGEYVDFEEID